MYTRSGSTQIGLGNWVNSQNLLKLEYSYGTAKNKGNVQSQTITVHGVAHPFVQAYTNYKLNRLKSATETRKLDSRPGSRPISPPLRQNEF